MKTIQDVVSPFYLGDDRYIEVLNMSNNLIENGVEKDNLVYIICKSGNLTNKIDYAVMNIGGVSVCIDHSSCIHLLETTNNYIKPDLIITDIEDVACIEKYGKVLEYNTLSKVEPSIYTIPTITASDIATIIFTSGTTGSPKPLKYSHEQLITSAVKMSKLFPDIEKSDIISYMPQSALFQRIVNLIGYLLSCKVHYINSEELLHHVSKINPKILFSVPRVYEKLYDVLINSGIEKVLGKNIKYLISGSAPISVDLLIKYNDIGLPIYQGYGCSESSCIISCETANYNKKGSVGKPIQDFRIDSDNQLLIKGKLISESAIGNNYWLETGDCVELDKDGYLFITGRLNEIFKTSTGRKIVPIPIENLIKKDTGVIDCIVFGEGLKALVAVVIVSDYIEIDSIIDKIEYNIKDLYTYNKPIGLVVSNEQFSIEDGSLTSNLKYRRSNIYKKHKDAIDAVLTYNTEFESSSKIIWLN